VWDDANPHLGELLNVETTSEGTDAVIRLSGELDVSAAKWFVAYVATVLEQHPASIRLDARDLSFLDSSGLRSLLLARHAATEAGVAFRVSDPSPPLRHKLERTGLQAVLLDE
jgi:anti-anti-sigma factor